MLIAAKSTDYMEKCYKQKLHRIEFSTKNLVDGYLSICIPGEELENSRDLPFLKYYIGQEWESRFTLTLNTVKNIDYIEKLFKQKLSIIKFPAKNLVDSYLYLSQEWSWGAPKICRF